MPETLDGASIDLVAFLSIDMNCVVPEIAAVNLFWPKMACGGIVLLDDYGFPGHAEQKRAFDRFAAENDVSILALPTGQGVIVR